MIHLSSKCNIRNQVCYNKNWLSISREFKFSVSIESHIQDLKMNIAGDHKLTLEEITLMIKEDPLIKDRIIEVLKMNPYDRRLVLNNWLEQLHIRRAPENLQHALSTLFDNKMAEKVLTMINNTNI